MAKYLNILLLTIALLPLASAKWGGCAKFWNCPSSTKANGNTGLENNSTTPINKFNNSVEHFTTEYFTTENSDENDSVDVNVSTTNFPTIKFNVTQMRRTSSPSYHGLENNFTTPITKFNNSDENDSVDVDVSTTKFPTIQFNVTQMRRTSSPSFHDVNNDSYTTAHPRFPNHHNYHE